MTTVADVVALLAHRYPRSRAEDWDRVRLVPGEPTAEATTMLCTVDCVPAVVDEAEKAGDQLVVAHHPLVLRSAIVSDLPTDSWNLHAPSPAPAGDLDTDTKEPRP